LENRRCDAIAKKKELGHLFIHNVTVADADKIMGYLEHAHMSQSADWWPNTEIDQFDSAAMVTISKQSSKYHSLRNGKHYA
jgi:hypothetical protein